MGKSRVVFYFLIGAIFLCMVRPEPAGPGRAQTEEIAQYVEGVLTHEAEFALKSPANKNLKGKGIKPGLYRCIEGHWVSFNDRLTFICD